MKYGHRFLMTLAGLLLATCRIQSVAAEDQPALEDPQEETKRLSERIENSIDWYEVLPDSSAKTALKPLPVMRWRNVARGQDGEAMMVVWAHNGRPVAMASIFPWEGYLCHEFGSLSRQAKLVARDQTAIARPAVPASNAKNDSTKKSAGGKAETVQLSTDNATVVWSPSTAGLEFKTVPDAPAPADTPTARLRQMKAIAERFKGTMTGWKGDNSDREELRLLLRPLYRYELKEAKEPTPNLQDGALFAFVMGTDPEIVLILEAVGPANEFVWQYAFARATSGGLEAKLDGAVVWTADKFPANRVPTNPQVTLRRPIDD
jgi:hypothetical protein